MGDQCICVAVPDSKFLGWEEAFVQEMNQYFAIARKLDDLFQG